VGISALLVVTQMALSLLLVAGAGLFDRTIASLHNIPLGFNREHVLLFTIRPYTVGYDGPASLRLYHDLRDRLRQLHGVRDVGLSNAPLPMGGGTSVEVAVEGSASAATPPHAVLGTVGPDFFKTMQIPIVAGREFTERDDAAAPRVVVVNRRFADVFGIPNPIGRILTTGFGKDRYEIVGLCENALTFSLKGEANPAIYFSYRQSARTPGQMTFEIRTIGDPLALAGAVREVVREGDSRIALHDIKTEVEHIDRAISTEIMLASLCTAFAVLALVLSCVGLYGTVAFNVARRTQEIGIRSALGATGARLVWMVLRDVVVMAIAGLAIGIPLVFAGSRYVTSFLYGVMPNDPRVIGVGVVVLLAAALLAGFVPASRAARVDPLLAIRSE
jgi:predicted permease